MGHTHDRDRCLALASLQAIWVTELRINPRKATQVDFTDWVCLFKSGLTEGGSQAWKHEERRTAISR